MRHQAARHVPEDLLSPTSKKSAFRRTLEVVLILVILSFVIAAAAWLAGRSMSHNEFAPMRRVTTSP